MLWLIFILPCALCENVTLELLSILFRHGERSPSSTYQNDPYKNYKWLGGWGQLTMRGKKQVYDLGIRLRNEYDEFLTDYYLPDQVYVLSSYAERCHMSAQLLLAGLYPPKNEQIWSPELSWQPIPVHENPRNLDKLIAMRKPCARYDRAYDELYKSEKVKAINQENSELYEYLRMHTGSNISSVLQVESLYNTLEIQQLNNLTLPDWTGSVFPEKMKPVSCLALALFTDDDLMKRFKGGAFIQRVIDDMERKRQDSNNEQKLLLYSGHDVTIVNVLRTLGLDGALKPGFAASLIFELYKDPSNNYFVKVLYRDDGSDEGREVTIRGCSSRCSLAEFKEALKAVTPSDWEAECELVR